MHDGQLQWLAVLETGVEPRFFGLERRNLGSNNWGQSKNHANLAWLLSFYSRHVCFQV